MKTKKPRSGKAVKPAARTVRRVTRRKLKTTRAKASPAKRLLGKAKTTKRPAPVAKAKPRAAARNKRIRKRVIRKTLVKAPSIPVESKPPAPLLVASPEHESGIAVSEQADGPCLPAAEKSCEVPTQAEPVLKTPPILLEGDEPTPILIAGPGQKYALGPAATEARVAYEEAALPEAYGTGKLLLAARDPHWLYAHWDLTPSQQRHYNALSADRHLVVRVHSGAVTERPLREVHVHPESRHWFIHVDRAETPYVAELGYYRPARNG